MSTTQEILSKTQEILSKTQEIFTKTQEMFTKTQEILAKTQAVGNSSYTHCRKTVQKKTPDVKTTLEKISRKALALKAIFVTFGSISERTLTQINKINPLFL